MLHCTGLGVCCGSSVAPQVSVQHRCHTSAYKWQPAPCSVCWYFLGGMPDRLVLVFLHPKWKGALCSICLGDCFAVQVEELHAFVIVMKQARILAVTLNC